MPEDEIIEDKKYPYSLVFEGNWIDPNEDLPEEMVVVIVALEDSVALGYRKGNEWTFSNFQGEYNCDDGLYCWQPLPYPFAGYDLGLEKSEDD
jgi:hypothetical protein